MSATPEEIDAERARANQSLPPRRVWEEQRVRALAQAIVRRMGHEAPMVASAFDLAHIRDWAAEIVELCERHGGQQAKPNNAKEVPEAPEPKPEPTSTTERIVSLIRDRHARGLAKYGVTVDRGDLTPEQWAQHAIEEMLDGAAYLMRLRDTMAKSLESMEAIRRLEADNRELRDRLAVAQRQRDEAAAVAKEQRP